MLGSSCRTAGAVGALLLALLMSPKPAAAAPVASPAVTAPPVAFSPSGKTMQAYPLTGAKCLDGTTPVVYVNQSVATRDWVIQIGR